MVSVADFRIDRAPVTNAQFARFVTETGYVTACELPPDPADYPGMPPELARPGSLVFDPPDHAVPLTDPSAWWDFRFGADWRHPLGPDSSVEGLDDHPVVHVVHADAAAYARWAGLKLPTEEQWEYAACGGHDRSEFAWGKEREPGGIAQANIWQGTFPHHNLSPPGRRRTSAIGSFPANGHGLYDMIGNVWEWTDSWYGPGTTPASPGCCATGTAEKRARDASVDPALPGIGIARKITKGGSHLCAPEYCQRYRPAARWPQGIDTSTSHLGFRCIRNAA